MSDENDGAVSGNSLNERSRPAGQVCPNPDCHIDQRWEGFNGLACPECATRLVVACSLCDSGAVERNEDGEPLCSDHNSQELVADGGETAGIESTGEARSDGGER